MNIQFLILFMLTGGFGDFLGQNRLANNRLISLMAEMAKTQNGRKAVRKFLKIFENQETKNPSHYLRRVRAKRFS